MSRVKPILFNTDMVQAILDGRKTVTRRVIKPHNAKKGKDNGYCQGNGLWINPSTDNGDHKGHIKDYSISPCWISRSYYIQKYAPFQPGDILYVRETWCQVGKDVDKMYFENSEAMRDGMYLYKADGYDLSDIGRWRPSIHMPKTAARIWLKVTNVRVERLQNISVLDVNDEGVRAFGCEACLEINEKCNSQSGEDKFCVLEKQAKDEFIYLWDSTIKKSDLDHYGWNANPWLWVIEFERCKKPENI